MTRLGRRTPTILNLARGELLMWDGRFETLEGQPPGPMSAPVEMNQNMEAIVTELSQIPEYRNLFKVNFPGECITVKNIAKAIATCRQRRRAVRQVDRRRRGCHQHGC